MSNTQQQIPATMFAELVVKSQQWAAERNFYAPTGATYEGQWLKLLEESGELAGGLARNKQAMVEDAIGDILVVLAVLDGFSPAETPVGQRMWNDTMPSKGYQVGVVTAYSCLAEYLRYMLTGNEDFRPIHRTLAYAALIRIADEYLLTLEGCFLAAYNEIKDRQGIMYNGVFIKDTDPRYAELADNGLAPCIDEGCEHSGTVHYCVNHTAVAQDIGCSAIDVRSMQEDDIVDN